VNRIKHPLLRNKSTFSSVQKVRRQPVVPSSWDAVFPALESQRGLAYAQEIREVGSDENFSYGDFEAGHESDLEDYEGSNAPVAQVFTPSSIKTQGPVWRFVLGPHLNLEGLFTTALFAAVHGRDTPIATTSTSHLPAALTTDNPGLRSLNRPLDSVSTLSSLLLIGRNLRHEASLLCTVIRRAQRRRGTFVATVRSFSSQRLRHQHVGSSFRVLTSLLENRLPTLRKLLFAGSTRPSAFPDAESRPSVFLGVDALRASQGASLESLSHALAFRFRTYGTKSYARFGVVHASIGSLATAALSLRAPRRVSAPFAGANTSFPTSLVTAHHDGFPARLQASPFLAAANLSHIHVGTHRPSRRLSENASFLPAPSLYEQKGHRITLEGPGGRVRNHSVATTSPASSRGFEVL
jgi:hypothetical protein